MQTPWLDFKALRAKLDFESVLKHYGVEIKKKGAQHHGFCPLPNHNGKRNSPSFSVNLERGIFQCFGCGAKGNALEFAALMENVDPKDGAAFRDLGLRLQAQFCPELDANPPEAKGRAAITPKVDLLEKQPELPLLVNQPLDFELKGLDANHPYLLGRGFTLETVKQFGLGFCSRGMLKNRIAIPLHDQAGQLIGYAGRVVDDALIGEENPRYRFPGDRKRDGKVFEFKKTLFVYNGFRIRAPLTDLIVVESFTAVWWLNQNGFPNVVATMGADCSEGQAKLIVSAVQTNGRVWIFSDADDAGERLALGLFTKIAPHRAVRWLRLAKGKQPTDCMADQLKTLLPIASGS